MFNLQQYRTENITDILRRELAVLEIYHLQDIQYKAQIGDECVSGSLVHIKEQIKEACNELKKHLWHLWDDLSHLTDIISHASGHNTGGFQNSIFLHSIQHAYSLSSMFSQLQQVKQAIKRVFYCDISDIDNELVEKFNILFLRVRLIHHLILREFYRIRVINCFLRNTKTAQISGPWANLDLPMKERMWEWDDEEEEYFSGREQAIKDQVRYNPENQDVYGFYFIWTDLTRDPYKFEDMAEDSPYKSRHLLTIP